MAQTIKLKRSSVSGNIPLTTQLDLGEVALNTYDGKMYIKKDDGTEQIIEVGYNIGVVQEYVFTASAAQTAFTGLDDNSLPFIYNPGNIQVFLNGILLEKSTDFTETSTTTLTLSAGAAASDILQVFSFNKKIGDGKIAVNNFTGDGSTTTFTLSVAPEDENNLSVFIDGIYQSKSNYSVSGTTLDFGASPPPLNTDIEVEIATREVSMDTATGLSFADNVKAKFGNDDDLQIYHDGSASYIHDVGTGNLKLLGNNLTLKNADDSKYYLLAQDAGPVAIHHDGNQKLRTTTTGIDVTGTVTADGLTVDGSGIAVTLQASNSGAANNNTLRFVDTDVTTEANQSFGKIEFETKDVNNPGVNAYINAFSEGTGGTGALSLGTGSAGAVDRINISSGGDISFYDAAGTTAKLVWKAADERLGIGTASPQNLLHVDGGSIRLTDTEGMFIIPNGTSDSVNGNYFTSLGGGSFTHLPFVWRLAGANRMLLDTSGRLGIGTTSPNSKLEVSGPASSSLPLVDITNTSSTTATSFGLSVQGGGNSAGNGYQFQTKDLSGNVDFFIRGDGKVGIGTTAPVARLHVNNDAVLFEPVSAAVTGGDNSILVSGIDANLNLLSYDDDSTIATNLVMGRYHHTTGNLIDRWGIVTNYNTGSQGSNTSNALTFNYGTSSNQIYDTSNQLVAITPTGNVGIGTTSPSTNLHVNGADATIRISGDNSMAFHQDSAWNSNIYFGAHYDGSNVVYGATGRGAFRMINYHDGDVSPQYIAFYGANSGTAGNTISWNTVGFAQDEDGNVGIGTTSPAQTLHVDSSSGGIIRVSRIGTSAGDYGQLEHDGTDTTLNSTGATKFYNNGNYSLTIDSSGHVLVGTTTNTYPRSPLTVFGVAGAPATTGTSAANVALRVATTTGNSQSFDVGIYNAAPYGTWLQANNSGDLTDVSPLVLNPNGGNVGIGTTDPTANLELVGSTGVVRPEDAIFKLRGGGGDGLAFGSLSANPWNSWIQSGYLLDGYSPEWNNGYGLLLNPEGGKVGIGTTSIDTLFHVKGDASTSYGAITAKFENSGGNGSWLRLTGNGGSSHQVGSSEGNFKIYDDTSANTVLTIDSDGDVGIGTNEPAAKLVVQDNIIHTSNPPTYRGSLIIASDGSQTSAGGLEFHSSIGGGAGYGGRIVTDSSANMLFFARSNSTGWTKTLTIDPTGSAALTGALSINDNPAKFASPVYRGTATGVSNAGYTTLFTVTGGGYGSTIKFTLVGTAANVVVNLTADLIVGHFEDILISTQSGFYTTVTLKVTSNNNENFAVEATTNHANPVTLAIEVFPFSNEQVTFTNSHTFTGSSLTHTAPYGHSTSGTGGNSGDITTAGIVRAPGGFETNSGTGFSGGKVEINNSSGNRGGIRLTQYQQNSIFMDMEDNSHNYELFNSYGNFGIKESASDPFISNLAGTNYLIYYTATSNAHNARTEFQVNGNLGLTIQNNSAGTPDVTVAGTLTATSKSFDIEHPTKPNHRLRYGSLEGPENGVYVRGRLSGTEIELPEYWTALVDPDSITVSLTPIGPGSAWVEKIENNKITTGGSENCFYHVFGERVDIEKLTVEYEEISDES